MNEALVESIMSKIPLMGCGNYIPLGVLMDVSGSEIRPMDNGKSRYENGVSCFLECLRSLQQDETMAENVHLFLSTFADGRVLPMIEGDALYTISLPELEQKLLAVPCRGLTNMGAATCAMLDSLAAAKAAAGKLGTNYSQPMLALVSDGEANDSMEEAYARLDDIQERDKLVLLPVGIGNPGARFEVFDRMLARCKGETPVITKAEDFRPFFKLLCKTAIIIEKGEYNVHPFVTTPFKQFGQKRSIA